MTVLGLISSAAGQIESPKGLWEFLLKALSSFIPNYVWVIIVFTVLLKLVLLPLDFYQKYKMKKNEIITKKMQPEMDKLARQYGDDKKELQAQQFKLQRASGISTFSACIPMILTMVIFITFFNGMRNISAYQEYYQYVNRYDIYVNRYSELTGLDLDNKIVDEREQEEGVVLPPPVINPSVDFDGIIDTWGTNASRSDEEKAAYNAYNTHADFKEFYEYCADEEDYRDTARDVMKVDKENGKTYTIDILSNGKYDARKLKDFDYAAGATGEKGQYDEALAYYLRTVGENIAASGRNDLVMTDLDEILGILPSLGQIDTLMNQFKMILSVAGEDAANAVYKDYKDKNPGFLWIKSIWAAEVFWADAVPDYNKFRTNVAVYMNDAKGLDAATHSKIKNPDTYKQVMGKVIADDKLSGTNGYLVLAVLAIGLSFLSQFITTRQQKKAGTTMTANGSFKAMTYIMPVVIGVFALFSTAAFSIYMVTNSAITLLINLLTTFIVGMIFKKDKKQSINAEGIVRYGRKDPNEK